MAKKATPPAEGTPANEVGHPGLHPLPDSLPGSLWLDLARLFRGQLTADPQYATHLLWHCGGYGLRMWEGEKHAAGPAGDAHEPLTREQAAEHCDRQAGAKGAAGDVGAVPWLQLALLAIDVLREYLKKRE